MFLKRQTKPSPPCRAARWSISSSAWGTPAATMKTPATTRASWPSTPSAEKLGPKIDRLKFKSLCGDAMIGEHRVLLMKPSTFMNNSGEAVRDAMQFHKIPIEQVLVLFDDVSLDVGRLRIRRQGSDGGHNGIKSIIYLTGKDTFPRVKIGVGKKPRPDYDLAAWVLGKFPADRRKRSTRCSTPPPAPPYSSSTARSSLR